MKEQILLIEPGYKNKYPPLGLMKIAYFHRVLHHDYVQFAKGRLPDGFAQRKWNRIYVTSLFTFEFDSTVEAIEYAKSLADADTQIIVGGIAATLLPDLFEERTGIRPITGALNEPGKLGLEKDECIDVLPLDYSILGQISYTYPAHDAYFLSATKGCGMRCGFCAVQRLEPHYVPYIDIKEKVHQINDEFGEKRDLLLMDNNVLISKDFDRIIDDILELGFERGATLKNPRTGKIVRRYVDFNQGLDAKLLNEHKAKRLGEIALSPARIAFDHIEDEAEYVRAIELCCRHGVTELSNYLLYNSENFSGKGSQYAADTPANLYERMRISLDLQNRLNEELPSGHERISIFSFPMRFIPLDATKRGYIGSCWNAKTLRSVQCMLIPTQGKGVGKQSFFEADFGRDADEFVENLCMPERLLSARGHFVERREDDEQHEQRLKQWSANHLTIQEWQRLFRSLGNEKEEFIQLIGDNEYLPEKLLKIASPKQQRLYVHYLTDSRLLKLLGMCSPGSETWKNIHEYLTADFKVIYARILKSLTENKAQQPYMISAFCGFFGASGLKDLFAVLEKKNFDNDDVLKIWSRGAKQYFNFEALRLFIRYRELDCFDDEELSEASKAILNLDSDRLCSLLQARFDLFCEKVRNGYENEQGRKLLDQAANTIFQQIQMSFFK